MRKLRVLALMHDYLVPPADVTGIDVTNAKWKMEFDVTHTLEHMGHEVRALGLGADLGVITATVKEWNPHIVFNLMENFEGVSVFDQNVVSHLELLRIPYTGCNPRGLMLSRDKALSKTLLAYHRIPVPEFAVFRVGRAIQRPKRLKFPAIVKSLTQESSIGISQASVVEDEDKLRERVRFIHKKVGTDAIVERYIEGRELYIGVLGNLKLQVFPVWELKFHKLPEDRWHIATERVKWSGSYQKKYEIASGPANDLPEDGPARPAEAVQARLSHPRLERLRACRSAPRRRRAHVCARSQPEPAARLRRGLRGVGRACRRLLRGAPPAHHHDRPLLEARAPRLVARLVRTLSRAGLPA